MRLQDVARLDYGRLVIQDSCSPMRDHQRDNRPWVTARFTTKPDEWALITDGIEANRQLVGATMLGTAKVASDLLRLGERLVTALEGIHDELVVLNRVRHGAGE